MTDNEIIKALECDTYEKCEDCPYYRENCTHMIDNESVQSKDILDLINRQKAENEELISKLDELESEYTFYKISAQEQIESLIAGQKTLQKYIAEKDAEIERLTAENNRFADIGKMYSEIKSEAVKEFAERLKEDSAFECDVSLGYGRPCYEDAIPIIAIDNLVKEMAPTILNDKGEQNK